MNARKLEDSGKQKRQRRQTEIKRGKEVKRETQEGEQGKGSTTDRTSGEGRAALNGELEPVCLERSGLEAARRSSRGVIMHRTRIGGGRVAE